VHPMTFSGDVHSIVFRHGWLLLSVVTSVNVLWWAARAAHGAERERPLARRNPILTASCLALGNLPWVIMGIGVETGRVPTVMHFMNPRHGAFVLAFWGVMVLLLFALAYWVLLGTGVETLVREIGVARSAEVAPKTVKTVVCLVLLAGVVALLSLWAIDLHV
jgi:hypothetical protein